VLVSPGRNGGEGGAGFEREQAIDLRLRRGGELRLGNPGDQVMGFAAPAFAEASRHADGSVNVTEQPEHRCRSL
jgi:hypothetical protein